MWFREFERSIHFSKSLAVESFFERHEEYLHNHKVDNCNANLNTVACWGSFSVVIFFMEDSKWEYPNNTGQTQVRR